MADIISEMTESLRKPITERIKAEFTTLAHRTASDMVTKHFSKYNMHTQGGVIKMTGPGYLEIEAMLDKLFGSEKMKEKMQKFFDENYDRIFAETMEEAMKHGIRKEIFDVARAMASAKAKEHNVESKD